MYLISIYFDETTEKRIRGYMHKIGKATNNTLMLDGNVPPHITISAFQTKSDDVARAMFFRRKEDIKSEKVQWVSVGAFLPGVIYLAPILNEYLHQLSELYTKEIIGSEGVTADCRYMSFNWFPHSTLAKHLTKQQLATAFSAMQNQFVPFEGKVTKIGLAKTNPYIDLEVINLV